MDLSFLTQILLLLHKLYSVLSAPVQVPEGSAVIGPGQQAGVPSVIPPVTMDTAVEDPAPPPAKKTVKLPADGPVEGLTPDRLE